MGKKKIDTISLHNPAGYKERVGVGGVGSLKRLQRWAGEREKQPSGAVPGTFFGLRRPPPSLHHLASGGWTTAPDGGASVLSVLAQRLWVYYRLALPWRSPAASPSPTLPRTRRHTNARTHKRCAGSEPSSLSAPSHLPMWGSLLPQCLSLWRRSGRTKSRGKKGMLKRGPRWCWKWRREAMNAGEGERKGRNIPAALLLLANPCSLSRLIRRWSPAARGDSGAKMWHRP